MRRKLIFQAVLWGLCFGAIEAIVSTAWLELGWGKHGATAWTPELKAYWCVVWAWLPAAVLAVALGLTLGSRGDHGWFCTALWGGVVYVSFPYVLGVVVGAKWWSFGLPSIVWNLTAGVVLIALCLLSARVVRSNTLKKGDGVRS
ncbi:MAG: hypothetical protein NZ483_00500 [Verrucomicrobiae bacterium]|nr:hypothetical protein [Verrucomicrobiae bacterium]